MRHGQSMNNEMRDQSEDIYLKSRSEDADLTIKGAKESRELGAVFKHLGIKVDGMFTSPYMRAIKTAAEFRAGYQEEPMEV